MFAAGIAVRSLGHPGQRKIGKTKLVEDSLGGRELALTAVDQHQVWPLRGFARRNLGLPVALFLHQPGEAAGENLPHHGKVVRCCVFAADVELAVLRFH